jgi:hypothetical protein
VSGVSVPTLKLSEAFPGEEWATVRAGLISSGRAGLRTGKHDVIGTVRADGNGDYDVLSLAAVSRDPGRTQDYIDQIQDFIPVTGKTQKLKVEQFYEIYRTEGAVANAVRKIAAVVAQGGRWVVDYAKKGRYKKARDEAQAALDDVVRHCNSAPMEGVVSSNRGLQSVTHQLVRQALIEGSWVGRQVWAKRSIRDVGQWNVPVNIFSVSTKHLEPVKEVQGTGIEAFYWVPERSLLDELLNPTNKDVAELLKKYIPKEYIKDLTDKQKVLLDPALLMHVKHRGLDGLPFGQSFIEPCLPALAFKRNVEALDFVTTQTLINRLSIVKVGSSDPNSPYSDPQVALQRTALMTRMLADPSPNSLLVWNGDDVSVVDIGAYNQVLSLDGRHGIARTKLHDAIGLPSAMLIGESAGESGSRAAGWAAAMGTSAEVQELTNAIAACYEQLGERILIENGYTPGEIELAWVWDNSPLLDKNTEYTNLRQDYQIGAISIRTYLEGRGLNPDAEYLQKCTERGLEPGDGVTWTEVFTPVIGLPGQSSEGAPNNGRTPDDDRGVPPAPSEDRPGTDTPQ